MELDHDESLKVIRGDPTQDVSTYWTSRMSVDVVMHFILSIQLHVSVHFEVFIIGQGFDPVQKC